VNTEINSTSINKVRFGFFKKIAEIVKTFSLTEKIFFGIFSIIFIVSSVAILIKINNYFLVNIPENGGVLREGIIGTPRFINPLIAVSSADKDITSLVFAGLTRKTADGEIIPDLAERYEISEDGLEYRFFLKNNLKFHDGKKLTTEDVSFTILKITDPEIDSPKRPEWVGVTLNKVNETEIVFTLKQPYAPFIESTTIGILPKHLWENILSGGFALSKFNTEPIGAGPYKLDRIKRDETNIPESYTLSAFKSYALGEPFINKIVLQFVSNENDLIELFNTGKIDSFGGITADAAKKLKDSEAYLLTSPLPRIFGLFFNQNESRFLADSSVRKALEISTPKEKIINDVMFGFAEIADDSIPPELELSKSLSGTETPANDPVENSTSTSDDEFIIEAQKILELGGWDKNSDGIYEKEKNDQKSILSFSISTNNVPELVKTANLVADNWKKVGIDVSVKVFEPGDLSQTIIRPRNFEVLLFGMIIHQYPDLYAFWHSSQRIDPGLNITNYANISSDKLLDDLRTLTDKEKIEKAVIGFNKNIIEDKPAIFLYTPEFIYILPEKISGVRFNNIISGENRFSNIYEWFIETDKVWKIFN
jgi:peptide/nickel transport system substrate-binding protein